MQYLSDRALIPWQGGELLPAADDLPVVRIPAAQPEAPMSYHETREARRNPAVESDVLVPLLQAALTGGAVAVMVGLVAWAAGWSWRVPVVCFALALGLGWFWRLRLVDSLLWAVETWTGRDLDNNQVVGKPVLNYMLANPAEARAAVAKENRQDADDERRAALQAFVDKCYIVGTSEGAHGIKATGPDRAAFVARRDVLFTLGIAKWRNPDRPKAGWQMAVHHERARQILKWHVL